MNKKELTRIAALVEAVKKKDKDAFVELYTMTYQKTFFLALMIVKDRYLAEDVVQEVYINVLQRIEELKNNMTFVAWLNKITYRMSLQQLSRQKEIPVEQNWQTETAAASQEDIAEKIITKVNNEYLMEKIGELPRDLRAVIVLKYYEGMKMEEIAEILECPSGTVKSRLFHAKKRLREKLTPISRFGLFAMIIFLTGRKSLVAYAAASGLGRGRGVGILNVCLKGWGIEKEGLLSSLPSRACAASFWPAAGAAVMVAASLGGVAVAVSSAPVIEVYGWTNEPTNSGVEVTISVHSRQSISEVWVVMPSGDKIECREAESGIYRQQVMQNGEYEVMAWDAKGRGGSRKFTIAGIDRKSPDMDAYSYNFETSRFTAVTSDDGSGVDFEASYIMTEKGEKVKAESWDKNSGRIHFYTEETAFDFYLPDHAGNWKRYHVYTFE